jgi:Zn-dependent protease with chaperone function
VDRSKAEVWRSGSKAPAQAASRGKEGSTIFHIAAAGLGYGTRARWRFQAYTIAMKLFLLLVATVAYTQQPSGAHDNYYSLTTDARVGERFITQLQASGVTAASDSRLDAIANRLTIHSPQFKYRFLVFDGGKPSQDTAPNAAFPADWRRLDLDEAIAVAGGTVYIPRRLLSRDDAQLMVILAHAMGHVALRHPTRGMTLGELAQVEVQVASRTVPEEAPLKVKAVALKRFAFDRACEVEADGYGVKLLKDSGVDPATLVAYLRMLPPEPNKEMSVYPAPAERIESAQKAIAALGR